MRFKFPGVEFLRAMARGSLSRNTIIKLGFRVALVILVMTGISYFHVSNVIRHQTLENLAKFIEERTIRENDIFKLAEENHAFLKREFFRRMNKWEARDPGSEFNREFVLFADGTTRTRKEGFDGKREAFAFFGKSTALTPDIQRRAMTFLELSNAYGPAWHHRFQNVYFTMPENVLVGYWPEVPDWAHTAPADFYMPDEEFIWAADPEHNPQRKTVWTGLFYDAPSNTLMVSVETPLDVNGKQVGTIGHDILLNEFMQRISDISLSGSENFILRRDGRLIANKNLLKDIQEKNGNFNIQQSGDTRLKQIHRLIIGQEKPVGVIENPGFDEYLGYSRLKTTGWYLVEAYPKSLVSAAAFSTAWMVLLLGFLSLLVEMLIFYLVLQREVATPLKGMMTTIANYANGDLSSRLRSDRKDELGDLSNTFDHMADSVVSRTREVGESELRFRGIFEQAAVGIALVGLEGQWLQVNRRLSEIVGYEEQELIELTFQDITHPDDLGADLTHLNSLLAGETTTYSMEKRYFRKDGCLVWINLTVSLVRDAQENPLYFISIVEDINRRKSAEAALDHLNKQLEGTIRERTAELQKTQEHLVRSEKMAVLGQLAASVSHELRNPLGVIRNSVHLLSVMGKDTPKDPAPILQRIQRSTLRCTSIIEDMLEFARLQEPTLEPVEFEAWLVDMVEEYRSSSPMDIRLNLNATREIVPMDTERFRQVMVNLLDNAAQAMESKEQGRNGKEAILISTSRGEERLNLMIEDQGAGLDMDLPPGQVFEPLMSTKTFGVGLGLAIVKKIVESHHGTVALANRTPGPGAVATISVPLGRNIQ